MRRPDRLSPAEARRGILAAQGFGLASDPSSRSMLRTVRLLGAIQIDSVNVLSRAHYLPLFSRLGAYDRDRFDALASSRPPRVFEYWAHEASLLPVETQPLFRWRMAQRHAWGGVADVAESDPGLVAEVLATVTALGPATAHEVEQALSSRPERAAGNWGWNWSAGKRALEHLFWTGQITTAGRDRQFRRRYALTSATLPRQVLDTPTPFRADAIAELVGIAARALGVATLADLRDWFRLPAADTKQAVERLVEQGELFPVTVPDWPSAWRHRRLVVPRRSPDIDCLLVPFDPLIWQRERVERLFGMRYRIEIYTPAAQREFGYYVLPFLQQDRLTARVDLKLERPTGTLHCRSAWAHEADADTAERLAAALWRLAHWLGAAHLTVHSVGDLAPSVAAAAAREAAVSRSGNSPAPGRAARTSRPPVR